MFTCTSVIVSICVKEWKYLSCIRSINFIRKDIAENDQELNDCIHHLNIIVFTIKIDWNEKDVHRL